MNKVILLMIVAVVIVGCTSGPVPIGKDTFMISGTSGTGFASASDVLANLYAEGNQFCRNKGTEFQPVSERGTDGIPGSAMAHAQIQFRCLQNGDAELSRPTMKPIANVRIESDIHEKKEVQEIKAQPSGDMYAELKKLKELLDSGVITQSEFDSQKTRILSKYQ